MGEVVAQMSSMAPEAIAAVRRLEDEAMKMPQVPLTTEHSLHAGMYGRTIHIPAGVMITGVVIRIPTILIFAGDAIVYTADGAERWIGYRVIHAPANRKQAFVAQENTFLTMLFPTSATTVEEAEAEFTEETDRLLSRRLEN
jgi:hypothetical protein